VCVCVCVSETIYAGKKFTRARRSNSRFRWRRRWWGWDVFLCQA